MPAPYQQILERIEARRPPMNTIRQAIINAIDQQRITPLALYFRVGDMADINPKIKEVSMNHIVDYLAGRADMTGERLDSLLYALGLTIQPK